MSKNTTLNVLAVFLFCALIVVTVNGVGRMIAKGTEHDARHERFYGDVESFDPFDEMSAPLSDGWLEASSHEGNQPTFEEWIELELGEERAIDMEADG